MRPARRFSTRALWLVPVGFVMLFACSGEDDEPAGDPADCAHIAEICHPYDDESEFARECHETGHDATSAVACTRLRPACERECPPVINGGHGGASGEAGRGSQGGDGAGGEAAGGEGGASQ
jgi:hypothetical protein